MSNWSRWLERKFLLAVATIILNLLQAKLGLPPEIMAYITHVVMAWIGAEAVVDAVKTYKNPPVGPNPDDVAAGFHDPKVPKKGFVDPK